MDDNLLFILNINRLFRLPICKNEILFLSLEKKHNTTNTTYLHFAISKYYFTNYVLPPY